MESVLEPIVSSHLEIQFRNDTPFWIKLTIPTVRRVEKETLYTVVITNLVLLFA